MKKRNACVPVLIAFSFLAIFFCANDSSTTSKVTIDFDSSHIDAALSSETSTSSSDSTPIEVSAIDVKVYQGSISSATLIQSATFNKLDISSDQISFDAVSGSDRYFELTAKNAAGVSLYTGSYGPVTLVPQKNASIVITMTSVNAVQNAPLSITLLNEKGTAAFTDPGYLKASTSIVVNVYRPAVVDGVLNLGTALTQLRAAENDFTTSAITGFTAYPQTYQMIMVKILTVDGTVAAIGGTASDSFGTSTNAVSIRMIRPGRIVFVGSVPVTAINVKMAIGGIDRTMPDSNIRETNSAVILVPNAMDDYGKSANVVKSITIKYSVNGSAETTYIFDQTTEPLNWKTQTINF